MEEFTPSLENRIYQILGEEKYIPLKQHELASALRIPASERSAFRHLLRDLEQRGKVVCLRKNRWALPETRHELAGILHMHSRGFGFVIPEGSEGGDIYISEDNLSVALDGDRVQVRLFKTPASPTRQGRRPKAAAETAPRREGAVVGVLERRCSTVVGLLKSTAYYHYVIPDLPGLPQSIRVSKEPPAPFPLTEDHKVVIRLNDWTNPSMPLSGVIIEDLGPADADHVDVLSVMRQHGLTTSFPLRAQEQASQLSPDLSADALKGRRDLRADFIFTIDPEDAKDFDDAISLTDSRDGYVTLGVHIADVSHYVQPHSPVDQEAYQRATSIYLVDRTVTMLPPYLTTEVCSLQPRCDRLTHSVQVTLDAEGSVVAHETFPSVICSRARLNYDQVQALFERRPGHGIPDDVQEALARMRKLAALLRRRRMEQGALAFNLPEIRCVLDAHGHPVRFIKRTSSESYQLIEEFMLLANQLVAGRLCVSEKPAIYRIHEPPDDEQWERMGIELQALEIPRWPESREEMNEVARLASGTPMEYAVNLALLRNLKRARYSSTLQGHFGLGFSHYTHFTSPIRRYPDLLVHRLLKALESGRPPPHSHDDMARMAEHCSKMEEAADKAEEESVAVKRLAYYQQRLLAGDSGPYEALIVSVAPKGLIVEIPETLQRGMIPFSSLMDDFYEASEDRTEAVGRKRKTRWKIGELLEVHLARVDTARRRVDFYPGPSEKGAQARRRKTRARPQRKR